MQAVSRRLFLTLIGHLLTIPSHEFLDSTCGVDQFLLPSIKRMAKSADIDVYDRTLDTVDHLRLVGSVCRYPNPLVIAVHEDDRICPWMNTFFHVAACNSKRDSGIFQAQIARAHVEGTGFAPSPINIMDAYRAVQGHLDTTQ